MIEKDREEIAHNFSKLMKKHLNNSNETKTLDDETVMSLGKKLIIKYHDALKRLGEMDD